MRLGNLLEVTQLMNESVFDFSVLTEKPCLFVLPHTPMMQGEKK